jgi:hypothetical protein
VIGAVVERLAGLSLPAGTTVWLDDAPVKDAAGAAVAPPYVVVRDDGTTPEFDFQLNPVETTAVRVECYGATLAAADALAAAVRYGGGAVDAGGGLDFCEAGAGLPLTGQSLETVVRQSEQRTRESARGSAGSPVYRVTLRYEVRCLRTA